MRRKRMFVSITLALVLVAPGCGSGQSAQRRSPPRTSSDPPFECAQSDTTVWQEWIYYEYVPFENVGDLRSVRGVQVRMIERDARSGTAAFELTGNGSRDVLVGKQGGALKGRDDGHEYCWRLESVTDKKTVLNAVYYEHSDNYNISLSELLRQQEAERERLLEQMNDQERAAILLSPSTNRAP